MHSPIEVLYQDRSSETFLSYSFIECGDPAITPDQADSPYTDYTRPKPGEPWPQVVYISEGAGDSAKRRLRDIREIRAIATEETGEP